MGLAVDPGVDRGLDLEARPLWVKMRGEAHTDTRSCTQALVDLYAAWHIAEPGKGHDAKAAQWKAKLGPNKSGYRGRGPG